MSKQAEKPDTQELFPIPEHLKIVTVAEMQRLERESDAQGHSYAAMMEEAGAAVAEAIQEEMPALTKEMPVLVLVGPGNNGGDGLVCARRLQEAGYEPLVYLWKRATDPEHDYQGHFNRLVELGVTHARAEEDDNLALLDEWLAGAGIVVDAFLGTGANRPIEGLLAQILDRVAEAQKARRHDPEAEELYVVAVDCPSGLNCDTGQADPHTLTADMTVTFGYAKRGQFIFPGAALVGDLIVADIGIDPALAQDIRTFALKPEWVGLLLPPRPVYSHKGTFGKGMAVVGSINYPGAARLSCTAMGRVGAGLVTGAVPHPVWGPVATGLTEATWLLLSHELGVVHEDAVPLLQKHLGGYDALLVGCGLTQEESAQDFLRALLSQGEGAKHSVLPSTFRSVLETSGGQEAEAPDEEPDSKPSKPSPTFGPSPRQENASETPPSLPPLVLDADGLNCLAKLENWPELLPERVILTPHPAEMARLCGLSVEEVTANRWDLAREKAQEWGAVVLLKGPYTVIAHPDGRLAVLPIATPALATAGTGDVLAGAITGLLAQGLPLFEAACLGAWLHGRAGEICEQLVGPAGALAGDLLELLPEAMNELREEEFWLEE